MPGLDLPVLAIKEANDHLQALFLQNQQLESQVKELGSALKMALEENETLNGHIKTINDRVMTMSKEHVDTLSKQLKDQKEQHDRNMSEEKELYQSTLAEQKEEIESKQEELLSILQMEMKQHEDDVLKEQLQVLKAEESEKMDRLNRLLEDEKMKVIVLESRLATLKSYLFSNTKSRKEKVTLLNNVFKSTIENMSWCLSMTDDEDFIHSDNCEFNMTVKNDHSGAYPDCNREMDTIPESGPCTTSQLTDLVLNELKVQNSDNHHSHRDEYKSGSEEDLSESEINGDVPKLNGKAHAGEKAAFDADFRSY